MLNIYGIDVSKYQGNIDYNKVKAAGKQFVFVRLGWAGYDGTLNMDSTARKNIKAAKQAGLNVGIYVYSYCRTQAAAVNAAKQTKAALQEFLPLEYPVAFDLEDTSQSGTPYNTYSKSFNSALTVSFLDEMQQGGFYAMLYTYKSFAENYLDMKALAKYDLWIAQYAAKCTYNGNYGIWQYSGDAGRCDGVSTACDLNVSYKDYAQIIKSAGLNGFSKTPPVVVANDDVAALKLENEELRKKIKQFEDIIDEIIKLAKVS